jgi:translation initiation factor IF-2
MSAPQRLNKVLKELNISMQRAVEFLESKDIEIEARPTAKISAEVYQTLIDEFEIDMNKKQRSQEVAVIKEEEKEAMRKDLETRQSDRKEAAEAKAKADEASEAPEVIRGKTQLTGLKEVGKIDLDAKPKAAAKKKEEEAHKTEDAPAEEKAAAKTKEETAEKADTAAPPTETKGEEEKKQTEYVKLSGVKDTGKRIDVSQFAKKPKVKKVASSSEPTDRKKRDGKGDTAGDNKPRRRRISSDGGAGRPGGRRGGGAPKQELTDEQIQKQIKETLEKLTSGSKKSKGSKFRRAKREERREQEAMDEIIREEEQKTLEVTEFVTVSELATMMDVPSTEVISACMTLGIMVTMNQRLDAETLNIVAEEFGFATDFVDSDVQEVFDNEEDSEEDLLPRPPIVTVMGHVDHGKTSLLDYIRETNVIAGESGGITQHIGAYSVGLEDGKLITFLDTPGHEAFTAMRARGAQVTDVAVIVVAADDDVMPQTKEAISHAQAAEVPFVVAINKVDRETANPDKIREGLSQINVLTEDWGGKIQSQEISAKTGQGIKELLDKVLLEAEMLELKANPDRTANGTIIEASLDKGRGYISTILVQSGTLRIGDYMLAGPYSGKVRALLDERGKRIDEAGPATPASILGLDGAPQAGDRFTVMDDEREAKQIATKRQQLQREQSVRTTKNLTLEEIGRRLAIGDFQELNIVLKGDVDGSIEALSDSLQKLSTEQVQVNIIHKAVGQITESDILLAAASDAIVVGFQVRPSGNARKLAENEEVDIRLYSIIYKAIDEVRDAMEGLLSPDVKEEIVCNIEVRETFKISKVGTIAGCFVTRVRLIRDGVVVYTGELGSLKRFKDDVKEVAKGFECGMNIKNFNDIKVGDVIEGYEEVEVKKTL